MFSSSPASSDHAAWPTSQSEAVSAPEAMVMRTAMEPRRAMSRALASATGSTVTARGQHPMVEAAPIRAAMRVRVISISISSDASPAK